MVSTIRRNSALQVSLVLGALLSVFFLTQQSAEAAVTETPRLDVPIVLDGEVWATEQVGSAIVVGGNFTQVQIERDGPVVNQVGIFAYDIDTGEFLENFRPIFNSTNNVVEIRDLISSADGTSVYVGGRFSTVDDRTDGVARVRTRLAKLDIADGRLDRNFAQASVDAQPLSMALLGNELYVGGNFTSVFDLAPGRPPIVRAVGGLARFDATTGQFDTTFRYDSTQNIGRPLGPDPVTGIEVRTGGVARVALTPNNRNLVVAHRGAAIIDQTRGRTFDAGGLAVIHLGVDQQTHNVTGFRALHPDAADPIQEFYHGGQCNGRGVQIRDLAVSNSAIFLTHQGADSGAQCDTIVRFPNVGASRPTWVARAFDSVFSIELVGNDVYVGGHFRYLVNSSAPSPYPGQTFANGGNTLANGAVDSEVYQADPTGTGPGNIRFRDDLVTPGFVFPVGQIGLLDATTGFADPTYTPVSDALLGVLEITSIDRGLIIGQDRGRFNDFNVGRQFFLDDDPDAGRTNCSVSLNGNGDPQVTWNNIGGVNEWNIAANGNFVASVGGGQDSFVDGDVGFGEARDYELRYRRNGVARTDSCGSVTTAQLTLNCSATLDDDDVTVSWTDAGFTRVSIFRDGNFVGQVRNGASFTDTPSFGDHTYDIRAFVGPQRNDAACGTVTVVDNTPVPVLDCSATLNDDNVTVSWTDNDYTRVSVIRDGDFVGEVRNGASFTDTPAPGRHTYEVRAFVAGQRTDAACGTVTVVDNTPQPEALNCTAVAARGNVTLRWNDVGAASYQARSTDSWLATLNAGETTITLPAADGPFEIRYRLAGQTFNVTCG